MQSFNGDFLLLMLILLTVIAAAWVQYWRSRRPHQHSIIMCNDKKHTVKIIVDDCVSVDVALICPPAPVPSKDAVGAEITLILGAFKVRGNITMFTMNPGQRIIGRIKPTTAEGQPAGYEAGSVELSQTEESAGVITIGRLDEEPDNELAFQVVSAPDTDLSAGPKPVGIAVKFDGHSGDGVVEVNIPVNGEVTLRDATTAGLDLGSAADYTPPAAGGE